VIEVPSRGNSSLAIDPEPVHASSKEDEDYEVPLLSRSHGTKGPFKVKGRARPNWHSSRLSMGLMPSVEIQEQSSIARPIGAELSTTGVLPTPVPSSSSSEKLDYSGDYDVNWSDVHSAHGTSKLSLWLKRRHRLLLCE